MLSDMDYAHHFEDKLSLFLQTVINELDLMEGSIASATTNSFINEDQYDLRKLLSHMKEHTRQYAALLAMNSDLLYCYCVFLKRIGNQLAHKGYIKPLGQETDTTFHVVWKKAHVEVYLEYSYDLATKIIQGPHEVFNIAKCCPLNFTQLPSPTCRLLVSCRLT